MMNHALRLIRKHHDLTAIVLSGHLAVSNTYLSEIETGKRTASLQLINRYAKHFKINPSDILLIEQFLREKNYDGTLTAEIRQKMFVLLSQGEDVE